MRLTTQQLSIYRSPRPFAACTLRYARFHEGLGETADPSPVGNGEYRKTVNYGWDHRLGQEASSNPIRILNDWCECTRIRQ